MSYGNSVNDNSNRSIRYIYDLPYTVRKRLCELLDMHNKWRELGGTYMNFDCFTLERMSKADLRKESPTDELLIEWGHQNHTIFELFILLNKMKHYQAMTVLKPFIDSKYHHLIYEGFNGSSSSSSNVSQSKIIYAVSTKRNQNGKTDSPEHLEKFEIVQKNAERKASDELDPCIPFINYKELEIATNFWSPGNILGRGGFGVVYKGIWQETTVAVKRLEPRGNDIEFNADKIQKQQTLRELKYLNSSRHDNILPLYGHSAKDDMYCLIYQFMPNGSLEDRIQCRNDSPPLQWFIRYKIAKGTARGLQFLHGIDRCLVHGDIKSGNILLDHHFEPKIGDFGLVREGPGAQYIKVSRVQGTRPYLPDEFLRGKKLSTKVDTYSFGVVLFEIATGLRAYDDKRSGSDKFLKEYIVNYDEEKLITLIDSKAGYDKDNIFLILIELGKKCVDQLPQKRPEMVEVLKHLSDKEPSSYALHDDSTRRIRIDNSRLRPVSVHPQFLPPSPGNSVRNPSPTNFTPNPSVPGNILKQMKEVSILEKNKDDLLSNLPMPDIKVISPSSVSLNQSLSETKLALLNESNQNPTENVCSNRLPEQNNESPNLNTVNDSVQLPNVTLLRPEGNEDTFGENCGKKQ